MLYIAKVKKLDSIPKFINKENIKSERTALCRKDFYSDERGFLVGYLGQKVPKQRVRRAFFEKNAIFL